MMDSNNVIYVCDLSSTHNRLSDHPASQLRSFHPVRPQIHLHLPHHFEAMLQISIQPGLRRHEHALEPALVGALRAPFYQLRSGASAAVCGCRDEDLEVFTRM
jgi:hypothetical protein